MKRKLALVEDADDDNSPEPDSYHYPYIRAASPPSTPSRTKRQRCATLEQGFAHLNLSAYKSPSSVPAHTNAHPPTRSPPLSPYLASAHSPVVREIPYTHHARSPSAMEDDSVAPGVVLPTLVEEPTSPELEIPEVRMKSSSWYEPEKDRIVVTDLDGSDDEDGQDRGAEARGTVVISPALLDRIRENAKSTASLKELPTPDHDPSKALVLFKPLPLTSGEQKKSIQKSEEAQLWAPPNRVVSQPSRYEDDDAMDVE
ncbi:hypothetical protein SERLA73DRAFT_180670 [Serpula lacrymans var. lacrymans S7.3]|uniref:Uncharacterized protein n=2 Tax=Serpula lacrymans var. lacrymans TaxID=341189 RepID=F8PVS0_SERL3|nr:uncharacterized protein SERLADRAFT_466366 [Serpula lacrymans var. lacrymans S7.9]EGO00204.1 hypothetical protein SERLA73DRAFT_180670 [Serpula lacrymans var. lacrymans S7.3]EGO25762.1 hypothetical protein SERLADRAFT_466366 [Serpula lacrymans var. lacrymans S7.9]